MDTFGVLGYLLSAVNQLFMSCGIFSAKEQVN